MVVGLGSKREGSSSQLGHGGLMQRTKILEVVAAVVDKNKGVPYTHSDQPKKMRMKQARRMRQAAQRQANAAQQLSSSGSWFDRLLEFVAPAPSAAPIPEG